ncbi:SCP2 sterol-binding domain-containing protein [Deinococcus arenicola]|uniref:SCP2 sterol-binding domain-containing protein n=1 Tax=Deinococcus arenicola TaxID=2994950 RepID=A0ABU4DWN9_9DEIO|nr:SCP2 sterol-binding domain-containing protein [Deinococcus sp. ZS9-10]MDV6376084.1 SCP2 sterol-binding domain-containing protein [Deinococcus sp. ZS9-10]
MSSLPFQSGEELEELLLRVFLNAADSSPVQQRLALTFTIHAPSAWLRVDGRNGQTATLSRGDVARQQNSDLTFAMSGETAHAFWRGDLNTVAAMTAGKLKITGPLLRALALAPGLAKVQAAYRQETGEAGSDHQTVP